MAKKIAKKAKAKKKDDITCGELPTDDAKKTLYVRSGCCRAPWALVYVRGKGYVLRCFSCSEGIGGGMEVLGPSMDGEGCAECGCCKGGSHEA